MTAATYHDQQDDGTFGPLSGLLAGWQGGDRRCGDRFFRRLQRTLRPQVAGLARDLGAVDGDDLLQDVFLTFAERLSAFDGGRGDRAIVAWFRTSLRRRGYRMATVAAREGSTGEAPAVDPSAAPLEAERRLTHRSRLDSLERVASDRRQFAVTGATRARVGDLLGRLSGVLLGDQQPAFSKGDLAARLGWTPSQMWRVARRLEAALSSSTPSAAEHTPPAEPALDAPPADQSNGRCHPAASVTCHSESPAMAVAPAGVTHPPHEPGHVVRRRNRERMRRRSCVPSERYRIKRGPPCWRGGRLGVLHRSVTCKGTVEHGGQCGPPRTRGGRAADVPQEGLPAPGNP